MFSLTRQKTLSKKKLIKHTAHEEEKNRLENELNSAIIVAQLDFRMLATITFAIQKLAHLSDETIYLCDDLKLVKRNGVYILHKSC